MNEPMTKEDMMRWAEALREEMRAQVKEQMRALEEQRELDAQHRAEDKAAHAARVEEARRRDDRHLFAGVMATLFGGCLSSPNYRMLTADIDFADIAKLARRIINEGGAT